MTAPKLYKPKIHEIIKITWIDSYVLADSPWERDEHLDEAAETDIVSVGFYLKKTARFFTFAQSLSGAGEYGGVFRIPVGCILKIEAV